ncbi:hypothetical protein EIP86_002536 [Pleurotus ostreatoroseus]|nr:hypothetical protein EIP86_002536 [Pleurotus ostreatoroseus]
MRSPRRAATRDEEPAPPYSAKPDNPPAYSLQESYEIGNNVLRTPLVQIPELKAHLSLLRALKELRKTVENSEELRQCWGYPQVNSQQRWMGTIRYEQKAVDENAAKEIKAKVFEGRINSASTGSWETQLLKLAKYKVEAFRDPVAKAVKGRKLSADKVLGAYSDDMPFSVGLVNAVLRQCSFIDKMRALGWTDLVFFTSFSEDSRDLSNSEAILHHAIARYHA